jgi:hypothetical protein
VGRVTTAAHLTRVNRFFKLSGPAREARYGAGQIACSIV